MTLRNSDLQSVSDLDSIRNSCNVSLHNFAWSWLQHGFDLEVYVFLGPNIRNSKSVFAIGPRILSMARLTPSARRSILHLRIDCATFRFPETAVSVKNPADAPKSLPPPFPQWQ